MKIFIIFLMLCILSVGFAITMDMLLKLPLQVSIDNMLIPFQSMMTDEIVIISLILLYFLIKPLFFHFMKKK